MTDELDPTDIHQRKPRVATDADRMARLTKRNLCARLVRSGQADGLLDRIEAWSKRGEP